MLPLSERTRSFTKPLLELTEAKKKQSFDNIVMQFSDRTSLIHSQSIIIYYQLVSDSSQYVVSTILHHVID